MEPNPCSWTCPKCGHKSPTYLFVEHAKAGAKAHIEACEEEAK